MTIAGSPGFPWGALVGRPYPSRPPAPHRTVGAVFPPVCRAGTGRHTAHRRASPGCIRPASAAITAVVGLGRPVEPPLQYPHAGQPRIGVRRALSPCGQSRARLLLRSRARSTGPSLSRRCAAPGCRRYYGRLRLPTRPPAASRLITRYRRPLSVHSGAAPGLPSSGTCASPRAVRFYAGGSAVTTRCSQRRRCQASPVP